MENNIPEYELVWQGKASFLQCCFVKIYTLSDSKENIFYIGATTDTLENRLKAHFYHAKTNRDNKKKNQIIVASNFDIKINLIDITYVTGDTKFTALNKARFLEYKWICDFRNRGYDLTNSHYEPHESIYEKVKLSSDLEIYLQRQKSTNEQR